MSTEPEATCLTIKVESYTNGILVFVFYEADSQQQPLKFPDSEYTALLHIKISSYWLLKKELWNKICPEVHLLRRESDLWNTWPDYRLYVKAEPQGFC